jgi:formylmethanofuran dehydrogenase subunit E
METLEEQIKRQIAEQIGKVQECDLCHDVFGIWDVEYNGRQFLCLRCRGTKAQKVLEKT